MIIVHHLDESRSQRILWLLEELGLPYEVRAHRRDAKTRLAPPDLRAVHPLGKAPVIVDGDRTIHESGAIVDYLVRRCDGRLAPAPGSAAHEAYLQWLHYAEGSAMLPLMLHMYVGRLFVPGAPLRPRIDAEIANHLGYVDGALAGRDYLVADTFGAADVQMSFVGDVAGAFGLRRHYSNLDGWLDRLHTRPAYRRAIERGGPYALGG